MPSSRRDEIHTTARTDGAPAVNDSGATMIAPNDAPVAALPPLMTITEVAGFLRCSKSHVSKLVNGKVAGTARLGSVRLGRRILIQRGTLEAWLLLLDNSPRFR